MLNIKKFSVLENKNICYELKKITKDDKFFCEKKNLDLLNQNRVFKFLKKKKTGYSNNCSSESRRNSCKFYFKTQIYL